MNLKKLETYLRVNLLGPGPRLIKKEFTGPWSHKGWETLAYTTSSNIKPSQAKPECWGQETCAKHNSTSLGLFSHSCFWSHRWAL